MSRFCFVLEYDATHRTASFIPISKGNTVPHKWEIQPTIYTAYNIYSLQYIQPTIYTAYNTIAILS